MAPKTTIEGRTIISVVESAIGCPEGDSGGSEGDDERDDAGRTREVELHGRGMVRDP